MKQHSRRFFSWLKAEELGESLLIVVLAMTALVGVAATVTDMGAAYVKTAQTQTAVDAAVLAAGLKLPIKSSDASGLDQATATAREYLTKNGVADASTASVTFGDLDGGSYHSITVTQPAVSETAFARIFGINEITFNRSAQAKVVPCAALSDLVPLSIQEDVLNEMIATGATQHAILKYGSNTDEVGNGSFGAIDLDGVKGGGANDYTSWLASDTKPSSPSARCCPWSPAIDRANLFRYRRTLQRLHALPFQRRMQGGLLQRRLPAGDESAGDRLYRQFV